MAYDNRKPGDATVVAWMESARRGRWTFDAAREAILDHYATSTDYLRPGHITQYIRNKRQLPVPVRQLTASPEGLANPSHIRAVIAHLGKRLGWPERHGAASPELTVQCPHCGAAVGRPCARQLARGHRRGQWVRTGIHPSRLELAKDDT
jgi:hypothetical protein